VKVVEMVGVVEGAAEMKAVRGERWR
jgi:hypothetical protein